MNVENIINKNITNNYKKNDRFKKRLNKVFFVEIKEWNVSIL